MMRLTMVALLCGSVGLAAATADAAVLCKKGTKLLIRDTCKKKEVQLDPVSVGLVGPQGPQGPQGQTEPPPPECALGEVLTYTDSAFECESKSDRYLAIASYATSAHRTLPVDNSIISEYCGDQDGCAITMGMRDYDATGRVASRGPYRFYYNPATGYWRLSDDSQGRDNDGTTTHVLGPWACFFTDGNYNITNLGDNSVGFSVMPWTGYGTNIKCELLIED